jgi:hypothetical protein
MRNWSSCSSLLLRIRDQRLRDARNTHMLYIGKICSNLFIYFLGLLIFQCHNRVYNAWKGPFPMNLEQFRNHLETNYHLFGYKSLFSSRWFLFQPDYVQIELGKNTIDQSAANALRVFYGHYSYGKLLYIFHRIIEPTIDTSHMTVYVKFSAYEQSYSKIRYSYHFQSFSITTLRCIVEQLAISSTEFIRWYEKSIYIEKIEQMYDQNPIVFNMKVITKCGIIIGYLYQPTNEYVFPGYSYTYHTFNKNARAFDASSSYTPYMSYVLVALFIYFLFQTVVRLVRVVPQLVCSSFPILHSSIQEQMKESNITSLENLNDLLLDTSYNNNYHDHFFIIYGKYLVILKIDLHENNEEILRKFYQNAPFIIIRLHAIKNVRSDCIVLKNCRYVDFPVQRYNNSYNPANWLHERLMILNNQYRYEYIRFFACFMTRNRFVIFVFF